MKTKLWFAAVAIFQIALWILALSFLIHVVVDITIPQIKWLFGI